MELCMVASGLYHTNNAHTAPAILALCSQPSITDSPLGFAMKTKLVLYVSPHSHVIIFQPEEFVTVIY